MSDTPPLPVKVEEKSATASCSSASIAIFGGNRPDIKYDGPDGKCDFVVIVEHNDNEGEGWAFYYAYDSKYESLIKQYFSLIGDADEHFTVAITRYSSETVEVLKDINRYELTSYYSTFNFRSFTERDYENMQRVIECSLCCDPSYILTVEINDIGGWYKGIYEFACIHTGEHQGEFRKDISFKANVDNWPVTHRVINNTSYEYRKNDDGKWLLVIPHATEDDIAPDNTGLQENIKSLVHISNMSLKRYKFTTDGIDWMAVAKDNNRRFVINMNGDIMGRLIDNIVHPLLKGEVQYWLYNGHITWNDIPNVHYSWLLPDGKLRELPDGCDVTSYQLPHLSPLIDIE